VAYVRTGKLGKVKLARGFCYKGRKSIGLVDGPQVVPDSIDYDLWCGPASDAPPRRKGSRGTVHYDWHWFWEYGNGDYGNQGPHQVDIARWFLGEEAIAPFTMSVGGRVGYKDSAETPNTMIVYHGYKVPMIFETRGLPKDKAEQAEGWGMDKYKGVAIGNVIECEGGYVVVPSYSEAIIFDNDGKEITRFNGKKVKDEPGVQTPSGAQADSGGHHGNWIKAVRSRKVSDLVADVIEGHTSSGLVHTGNISYRLGSISEPDAIKDALKSVPGMNDAFDRMAAHLDDNGVNINSDKLQKGVPVRFDPKKEKFIGNASADQMLTRDYRAPFIVPAKV
jgi:hypothetical protein